jgi:RNA-binding protein
MTRPPPRKRRTRPTATPSGTRSGTRSAPRRAAPSRSAPPRSAAARSLTSPAAGSTLERPATGPALSEKQRRHLRGLAHGIKPVVWLGNAGLTVAVTAETARALRDHELIKVKATGEGDRKARDAAFAELAAQTASALIHRIGNVAVLYRPNPELSRSVLPDVPPA